jgi:hypothetical protein
MMNEIEPLLLQLEEALGATSRMLAPIPPVPKLTLFSASTTVGTFTSAAAFDSEAQFKKQLKDFE